MNLTEKERRSLGEYAEWRDLQIDLNNIVVHLQLTRLEDLKFAGVMKAVDDLADRRAAFFARWQAAQAQEVAHAVAHGAGAGSVADAGLSDGEPDDSPVWTEGEGQSIAGD